MKNILTWLAAILFSTQLFAQGLTQSADGKSTVFFNGNAISLDISKTDLSFGINNLNNNVIGRNNFFFWSAGMNMKNKGGFGSLFSRGKFVPESNVQAYAGYAISNAKEEYAEAVAESKTEFTRRLQKKCRAALLSALQANDDLVTDGTERAKAIATILNEFDLYVNAGNPAIRFAKALNENDADMEKALLRKTVKQELKRAYEQLKEPEVDDEITEDVFGAYRARKRSGYYRVLFFGFGSVNATDFKRFMKVDSADLSNSFKNEYFKGGRIGAGINAQYRQMRIGVTYAYSKTNNLAALTATEYTIKESSVVDGQTFSSEDKVTAYSGTYGTIELNELNVDFIYNLRLDPRAQAHVLLNPYLRANIASRNAGLLTNTMNLGLGGYFYKASGAFLGGLYVELPDMNNNLEKKKPIEKQNLQEPLKRLSFGVVAKISLKSLVNL